MIAPCPRHESQSVAKKILQILDTFLRDFHDFATKRERPGSSPDSHGKHSAPGIQNHRKTGARMKNCGQSDFPHVSLVQKHNVGTTRRSLVMNRSV